MPEQPAKYAPEGRFFILEWTTPQANFKDLEMALSTAQRAHQTDPSKTYIVAQVVATVAPTVSSQITFHRT